MEMHGYLKNRFTLFVLMMMFFASSFSSLAQTQKCSTKTVINNDGDTIVLSAIAMSDITTNIEITLKEIEITRNDTKPSEKIKTADSVYLVAVNLLSNEKKQVGNDREEKTDRALNDAIHQWTGYKNNLIEWQDIIHDYSSKISKGLVKTENMITVWELTMKDVKKENAPRETILNIREVTNKLKSLKNDLKSQLLNIYSMQSQMTDLAIYIDETIKGLLKKQEFLRKGFFRKDYPVIWKMHDTTFLSKNNLNTFQSSVKETTKALQVFSRANSGKYYLHFFIFLLLLAFFYFLHTYSIREEYVDKLLESAQRSINHYILSALIMGFLATIWIYPTRQLIVDDIFQLILLILITLLAHNTGEKKLTKVLLFTLALHSVNVIQSMLPLHLSVNRILLFIDAFLAFYVLWLLLRPQGPLSNSVQDSKWKFIIPLITITFLGPAITIIANIFGYVGLSAHINNIVVNSIINAFIAYTSMVIFTNALVLILRSDYVLVLHSMKQNREKILKVMVKYTSVLVFVLWGRSVLELFGVYSNLIDWITSIFDISWKIGDIDIDLGSVLTFILIIVITFTGARIIKLILEEEVFTRISLPRGVPGAISMIVGYFIVGWGFVVSLSALNINLSEFGLMAGALGVGIGFGLQDIVLNFISGLVLAFERPIQAGDTIEVGSVLGIVKSIGVRSSTIQTYDGSEVIVPNGKLISNDVVNWTLSNRRKRRDIRVGVAYGSNPHEVMEILRKACNDNVNVLQDPAPWILFEGFGDSSLEFRARIWTAMDIGMTTASEVTIAIYDGLNKANISIPFPQQDLHIKSVEPEVERIILQKSKPTDEKKS